jgi:hypothetical protein
MRQLNNLQDLKNVFLGFNKQPNSTKSHGGIVKSIYYELEERNYWPFSQHLNPILN